MKDNKRSLAMSFERRVLEEFEALGYRVTPAVGTPDLGVDFLVWRPNDPLVAKTAIEVKYYQSSLVPVSAVRIASDMIQRHKIDRLIIVTTLGFTEEAARIANESDGKISLLTEAELIRQIPTRERHQYVREFREDARSLLAYSLKGQAVQDLIKKMPKRDLSALLMESAPIDDILKLLIEKVPPDQIIAQLVKVVRPQELEKMLREIPSRSVDVRDFKATLGEEYSKAKSEPDPNVKGDLLEKVVKDILGLVPSLTITGLDVNDEIEEIDIQVRNHNREHVWADFEGMIFVECKNLDTFPVGADEIRDLGENCRTMIFMREFLLL